MPSQAGEVMGEKSNQVDRTSAHPKENRRTPDISKALPMIRSSRYKEIAFRIRRFIYTKL